MKAVVCARYGSADGLAVREVARPVPKADEVLVRVRVATVTAGDVMIRRLTLGRFVAIWPVARVVFGLKHLHRKILGHEFAGDVEGAGEGVTRLEKGSGGFDTAI